MKKLLVILVVALSIFMVGCGSQETKTSGNQNEAVERKECVDSHGNKVYTIDDEYTKTLEYNSKTNQY